jgi:uncharacterized phage protein gp47/JayE
MVQKNIFADTCDESTLLRFGRVKLNRDPYPATAGGYVFNITGNAGGVVAKGQTFKSNFGYVYENKAEYILSSTTGQINIVALTTGIEPLLSIDDELQATSPIANVESIAVVDSVTIPPIAAETISEYREKVLISFQAEPQGGAATDYRLWSSDANGVRKVYPYAKNNAIYVVQVFVEALPENSEVGEISGTPPASTLVDVEAVINQDPDTSKPDSERGRRPLQVVLEILPVVPKAVKINIESLSDKSTTVINDIRKGLDDLFYTIRPYISGAESVRSDTLYLSQVITAIYSSIPAGANFANVQIIIDTVTYNSYQFGEIPAKYGMYPYLLELTTP